MAKSETLTRYEIESHNNGKKVGPSVTRMNVLLDRDDLNRGDRITLDETNDIVWVITCRHETITRYSIKRGWNNNI